MKIMSEEENILIFGDAWYHHFIINFKDNRPSNTHLLPEAAIRLSELVKYAVKNSTVDKRYIPNKPEKRFIRTEK